MNWEYLSDDELDRLVQDVEAEPLCQAPEYLMPMILEKAKAYGGRSRHKTSAVLQLFVYSAKIMLAAAAAVIAVLTIPVMDKDQSMDYLEQSAQAELDRMRDRVEERGLAEMQNRTEYMNRANARQAFEERFEAVKQWVAGSSFADGWKEASEEE